MTDDMVYNSDGTESNLEVPANFESGLTFATDMAELDALEAAPVGPSINPTYKKFTTPGETLRGIFCGFRNIPKNEDGERKWMVAAVIQSKDGVYLQAGASLVPQFDQLPQGTPVQIKYTGKEKTQSGYDVMKYEVSLLKASVTTRTSVAHPAASLPGPATHAPQLPASNPVEASSNPDLDPDYITIFWSRCKTSGLDNAKSQQNLKEAGGLFQVAVETMSAFDAKCKEMGLTNIEAKQLLKEAGGSFKKAVEAVSTPWE